MMDEDEFLLLSGIQHYAFCPRQWALIHIEQQWKENDRTASGEMMHIRVHDNDIKEKRGDMFTLRDLPVSSHEVGITGKCDAVEFHANKNGIQLIGHDGTWIPYPVEYKNGEPKKDNIDELQLCAEAMCLEEMLVCRIPEGALYYGRTRHRQRVLIDQNLRNEVKNCFQQMHDLYKRGRTPVVKPSKACNACSLKELCLPKLAKNISVKKYMDSFLGELK